MTDRNTHHMAWPANQYSQGTHRRFREHEAMKVILPVETHNELHGNIPTNIYIPPKRIMAKAVIHLAEYDLTNIEPTEVADDMADFMLELGMSGLAQNLWYQIPYLYQAEYKDKEGA